MKFIIFSFICLLISTSTNLFILGHEPVVRKNIKVSIETATIEGSTDFKTRLGKTIYSFRGIRYAEPPIGRLRFMEPVPVRITNETIDATREGPACPQPTPFTQSEDCLRLNIYTKTLPMNKENKKPVIIYIHPGAFYLFSGQRTTVSPYYLLDQDVVLVTFNYRLGSLGFLSTNDESLPGNIGLKDQVVAMKWIQQYIEYFNGDKNSITLVGSEAGAWSISLHLVSPMSKNLFHRVILSSFPVHYLIPLPKHQKHLAVKQAQLLNCRHSSNFEILTCLQSKNASEIANSITNFKEWTTHPIIIWTPVVEPEFSSTQRFLTDQPDQLFKKGKFHKVPIIVGITQDEIYGIVNPYIRKLSRGHEATFNDLNDNWLSVAPRLFGFESDTSKSRTMSIELRKLYFNRDKVRFDNYMQLSKMFSDAAMYKTQFFIDLISNASSQPLFFYKFSYHPRVASLFHDAVSWTNGSLFDSLYRDDLFYIFYNHFYPKFSAGDAEIQTLKRMNMIYENFAKTGQPIIENPELFGNITWERYLPEKKLYLNINNTLKIKTYHVTEKVQIWKDLFDI